MEASILIVDDDLQLGEVLGARLASEGFEASYVGDGPTGIALVEERRPDLVILDARMPGMDGWETCREIRKRSEVPIIFLSCVTEEKEKVLSLNLGADDYIGKPFSSVELVARIRAVLRRSGARRPADGPYVDGELVIDLARREVKSAQGPIALTPTEAQILACLIGQSGEVVPRERLITLAAGEEGQMSDDSLRQHIHHIRQKIERDPRRPKRIVTRRGDGYQLRRQMPRGAHL